MKRYCRLASAFFIVKAEMGQNEMLLDFLTSNAKVYILCSLYIVQCCTVYH